MTDEWWIGNYLKRNVRSVNLWYYERIWLETLRKTTETSIRIAGVPVYFWTENLPHTSLQCFLVASDWLRLVLRPLIGLLYQPRMRDDVDCGAIGGKRNGKGNRSTRRKPAPVPLCPPQIPHDVTQARNRTPAVGSRRLTAWAMARPVLSVSSRPACSVVVVLLNV
jgi:hypothetical protein